VEQLIKMCSAGNQYTFWQWKQTLTCISTVCSTLLVH